MAPEEILVPKLYYGKTLAAWRDEPRETWPDRVAIAIANSDKNEERWGGDLRVQRQKENEALRREAADEHFAAQPVYADQMAVLREQIETEGAAFFQAYGGVNAQGQTVLTETLLSAIATRALWTLIYHVSRGDLRAAEIIISKALPEPTQSLDIRVGQMSKDELERERAKLLQALPAEARALIESRTAPPERKR
jgi:hypothetical protein